MIIKQLLYIFQANFYEAKPFIRFAYKHLRWWRLSNRQSIFWTAKILILYFLTALLFVTTCFTGYITYGFTGLFVFFIIQYLFLPILILLAHALFYPFDVAAKFIQIWRAKKILNQHRNHLIIIGITGSYGKTSTKEILTALLSPHYNVLVPGGNINTNIGIAQFLISHAKKLPQTTCIIIEMGAFRTGEIKKICDFVEPDYGLITGITSAHLEKFGSLEKIIQAKFELAQAAKKMVVLNGDDKNIIDHLNDNNLSNIKITTKQKFTNIAYLPDYKGITFTYLSNTYKTQLLAEHNLSLIALCFAITTEFGLKPDQWVQALAALQPIKHRLQPIYNSTAKIWVIDDSYNGNYNGFIGGLEVLSRALGRKIVLTPGLVELGSASQKIHEQLGIEYAKRGINQVLLIKNSATEEIVTGLKKSNNSNYIIFNNTTIAHQSLGNLLKPGDTILFQNDWPDNYF
ncbi:MAG: UDP-N-acetylmuramoyl-tripeptide--D-alanyl-D-alanine ligase [Candidatus Falkowbacteria bacterium]